MKHCAGDLMLSVLVRYREPFVAFQFILGDFIILLSISVLSLVYFTITKLYYFPVSVFLRTTKTGKFRLTAHYFIKWMRIRNLVRYLSPSTGLSVSTHHHHTMRSRLLDLASYSSCFSL